MKSNFRDAIPDVILRLFMLLRFLIPLCVVSVIRGHAPPHMFEDCATQAKEHWIKGEKSDKGKCIVIPRNIRHGVTNGIHGLQHALHLDHHSDHKHDHKPDDKDHKHH